MVLFLYEGVVARLDNNNEDDFDVDKRHRLDDCFETLILAYSLEYLPVKPLMANV